MWKRILERQAPFRPMKPSEDNFIIILPIANSLPGRVGKQGKEKLGMRRHVPVT